MQEFEITVHSDLKATTRSIIETLAGGEPVQVRVNAAAAVPDMLAAVRAAQRYLYEQGLLVTSTSGMSGLENLENGEMFAGVDLAVRPLESTDMNELPDLFEASILEDFAERQDLFYEDNELIEKLIEHTADSPILSGGDLDAAWDMADVGEETVGGTVSTPDQDRVDELGEAVGLTYDDDEPLDTEDKLEERDRHRWELDPRSQADE